MKKEVPVLFREGFWTGMGQITAYSMVSLAAGLIVMALLPDSITRPCPKSTGTEKKTCACGGH